MVRIEYSDTIKTITEDWQISEDQILVLRNCTVQFAHHAGIFCLGSIDAENCTFLPMDKQKGWKGIADIGKKRSNFKKCTFEYGRGRVLGEFKDHYISRYFNIIDDYEIIELWSDFTEEECREAYAKHYGGALITLNSSVSECKFKNCVVDENGGAVVATLNVEISECVFNNCHADSDGGAIYICGYTKVKRCRFELCGAYEGGAIKTNVATTIEESYFKWCSAYEGGGIAANVLTNVSYCHFRQCVSSIDGGGVYGQIKGERLAFIGCRAKNGGGARLENSSVLEDSVFYDCHAIEEGGGLFSFVLNRVEIEGCRFVKCVAGETGGGARIRHTTMKRCHFKDNITTRTKEYCPELTADHLYSGSDSLIDRCNFSECRFEEMEIPQFVLFETIMLENKYCEDQPLNDTTICHSRNFV